MFMLIVTDNTSLDQLLKLPVLFQHYMEHKEQNNSVSLMKFIAMHYWGDDDNDNDNDRDAQLPFKKFDAHPSHLLFYPLVKIVTDKPAARPLVKAVSHYSYRAYIDPALASPFRPPCA